MSRIISFRVWDKEEKKYLLPEQQEFVILPTRPSFGVTIPFQSEHYPNENLDIDCVDWADADLIMGRYELEQDTGLKDKNGEKIYENDIVLDYYDGEDAFIVKWDEDVAGFILTGTDNIADVSFDNFYSDKDLEVIGNVNENPELLGGKMNRTIEYKEWRKKQQKWKRDNRMTKFVRLRGNKKWCEKFGEDLSLPRFIGDKKGYANMSNWYPFHDK